MPSVHSSIKLFSKPYFFTEKFLDNGQNSYCILRPDTSLWHTIKLNRHDRHWKVNPVF